MSESAASMTREELRVFLDRFFCGCGDPESAFRTLHALLERFASDDRGSAWRWLEEHVSDPGARWLLLYFIDAQGLLEHGSGVATSWLTDEGKRVLARLTIEGMLGFEKISDGGHCIHGFTYGEGCSSCEGTRNG